MKRMKLFKLKGDIVIWTVFLLLVMVSLIEVYSSLKKFGNPDMAILKHMSFILFGFLCMIIIQRIPYQIFHRFAKLALILSLFPLLYVFIIDIGSEDAERWFSIGGIPLFQPSEITKLCILLYVSSILVDRDNVLKNKRKRNEMICLSVVSFGLILPGNLSTVLLLIAICLLMFFFVGIKRKLLVYIFFGVLVLFITVLSTRLLERSGTWSGRIDDWLNNDVTLLTQANYAKMAISNGNFFTGTFFGNNDQSQYISSSSNDFIFAICIEEGGILFGIFIIFLYLVLLYRGIRIAQQTTSMFATLIALGISFYIILQVIVNMFVATGLFPVTGQTLPLISRGGTSYVITCVMLGILLSISRTNEYNMSLAETVGQENKITDNENNVQSINTEGNESNN